MKPQRPSASRRGHQPWLRNPPINGVLMQNNGKSSKIAGINGKAIRRLGIEIENRQTK